MRQEKLQMEDGLWVWELQFESCVGFLMEETVEEKVEKEVFITVLRRDGISEGSEIRKWDVWIWKVKFRDDASYVPVYGILEDQDEKEDEYR